MAKIAIFLILISSIFAKEESICNLTAHGLPVNSITIKELAYLSIGYTFNTPFCPNLEARSPPPWEGGGIVFMADFNRKAKVFRKWLNMAQFRPSKLVIIDGGEKVP